jgi:cytochrome c oxidase assembly protein subunit 15
VKSPSAQQKALKPFVFSLWGLAIIQIVLGTQVRSKIGMILEEFPLLMGNDLIMRIGSINIFHTVLGIVLVLLTIFIVFKTFKTGSDFIRASSWIIVVLMIIQILTGATLEIKGLPQVLQLFHLWIASLIIGVVLILYTELSNQK